MGEIIEDGGLSGYLVIRKSGNGYQDIGVSENQENGE